MKPSIAFVTGGFSGESVISYKSAVNILKNVDAELFDVYKIDITPSGWFYESAGGQRSTVNKEDFSIIDRERKINFDAVLIGIHGSPGEDGKLQGYFDLMNLPYSSCDATCSALTFNKRYTVAVAAFSGIHVAKSVVLIKGKFGNVDEIVNQLSFPVFVKPNNGGSSIGMSKVNNPSVELGAAIEKAFKEDDQVLIEEFISGREFTIGVFRSDKKIITLPFTEIKTKKEFFDFEAKYTPGFTEEFTPAVVDESIAEKVRDTAKKVYQVFNCNGVIRIDFIYNEQIGELFLLEINTVPGQTDESIVPQQVRAMGWTLKQFYSALIEEALGRNTV
jgi:D-alanine-D-alanine ligase